MKYRNPPRDRIFQAALSDTNKDIDKIVPVRGGQDGTKGRLDEADGEGWYEINEIERKRRMPTSGMALTGFCLADSADSPECR